MEAYTNTQDSYLNPRKDTVYVSPSLKSFQDDERRVRIISKLINSDESYAFAKIKDEIVLRHTSGGNKEIKIKLFEDNRKIFVLSIQGYNPATDKPHNASFSFIGDEIGALIEFIMNSQKVPMNTSRAIKISDEDLSKISLTDGQALQLIDKHKDLFLKLMEDNLTKEDIIAVGYRKKQLEIFEKLLTDKEYFERAKFNKQCTNEKLWQMFFEKNKWIFGYGLGYLFLSGLDNKSLEQVVQGYNVNQSGKRVDALMKTKGLISNLCFVEIKTHFTKLLDDTKPYRVGCWAPSKELSGAIAQVHGTVASAIETLSSRVLMKDELGNPTREEIYNYQPKSFLVIGNLNEFIAEHGVNQEKLRSFELYRKNIINPEIITFDELYERAKFIVTNNEVVIK